MENRSVVARSWGVTGRKMAVTISVAGGILGIELFNILTVVNLPL